MSKADKLRVESYTVLILANRKTIDDVPERLKKEVEIAISEKTLDVLGD